MKKILVTDLIGTLIPDLCDTQLLHFYGNGFERSANDDQFLDKVFKKSLLGLRKFLENGNSVYLVTSINNHESPSIMLEKIIDKFYKNVKEYKDNVHIFLSGLHDSYNLDNMRSVSKQISKDHYIYKYFEFYHISKKEDVFDFVLNNHRLDQELLFAIGDSESDLPMLRRCIDLGGRSSIIDNSLYRLEDEANIDNLITQKVYQNISIDYDKVSEDDRLKIIMEFNKLYEKLRNGSLSYEKLLKDYKIKNIIDAYNFAAKWSLPRRKMIKPEAVKKLTLYPTFTDYNNKVLNK